MRYTLILTVLLTGIISSGCFVGRHHHPAAMGALMGAGAGAMISSQYDDGNIAEGALVGGFLGYTAGLLMGVPEYGMHYGYRGGYYNYPPPSRGHGPWRGERPHHDHHHGGRY